MPAAYEGTDIISCLRSKYIIRRKPYIILRSNISLFMQKFEFIRKNGKNIFFVAHNQKDGTDILVGAIFFVWRDSNPERVSGVKKTVLWTVFSREVRRGYAARTQDARRSRCRCIPPSPPCKKPLLSTGQKGFFTMISVPDGTGDIPSV